METKLPMTSHGRNKAVRVVARFKPSVAYPNVKSSSSSSSSSAVSVHKPNGDESETVSISFGAQFPGSKDSYKLDYCYEEDETTSLILTKEIKPLISTVFEGKDANVIAHGARGSGKTHLIQGSEKEPGLAVLTMAEMLSMAGERGYSILVSVYEVCNEAVYDISDQEKRVVSVLESAQGRIQLKGLSKVHVKSLSEFKELYFGLKKTQKLKGDSPLRSHRGVMIHVTATGSNVSSGSIGRMNFLDLAGYEDSRKQKTDLVPLEITRINKSIYALQNVMYALNANESHVPYRESKLTRMLKDCLQGSNRTLLITCLPRELSQDSFYMLNLASRICLGGNRAMANATKKSKGPARSISSSSVAQRRQTPLNVTASSKQRTELRANASERKIKLNTSTSAIKGRKLFGEANGSVKSKNNSNKMEGKEMMAVKKEIFTSKVVLNVQSSASEEEVCSSFIVKDSQSSLLVKESSVQAVSSSNNLQETPRKHEERFLEATNCVDAVACKAQIVERDDNRPDAEEGRTPFSEGENLEKENINLLTNEITSPPLSLRLQELSNKLKSICDTSNQPSTPEKYQAAVTKYPEQVPEHGDVTAEAELRTPERSMPLNVGFSPWKTFSAHSSKLKNSAVGEYLKFLNTADKEDLKKLKGIGEKRATYIVELRQESPEPFKKLDDLKDIGLSEKQIKGMLRKEIGEIFQ
ncbi:kinesin-like protein KIN-10C isoform X1 [Brassica napus]|uniref:kinesin-like protein KIN-10C isoform X1 n=1 Tax=Brassica napus TaxID=3708 RepID=UPI0020790724|nr:kinesin-like protein KIN-10C isoform X1 [Brassica napus]